MRQSGKRILSMAVSLVFLAASFIVYFNFLQPAYSDFEEAKAKVNGLNNFIETQQADIAQIKRLIDSYKNQAQLRDTVSLSMPVSPDSASALAQVSGLAGNNKIVLSSLNALTQALQHAQAETSTLVKPFGIINLQIKLSGSYENMKGFIKNLESDLRVMSVERLRIGSVPERAKSDFYDYDLTAKVYYQSK